MNKYVFISYQHEDGDFAEILKTKVQQEGFKTWTDNIELRAGEDWRVEIDQAIKDAFALIVIMTPEAKASEYVTYEWSFAWGTGIKVIPVVLKSTALHLRLETLQYLDFTNYKSRPWDKLISVIKTVANLESSIENLKEQNILFTKIIDAASSLIDAKEVEEASPHSVLEKTKDTAKSIARLITPKTSQQLSEAWVLWVDDRPAKNVNVKKALEALGVRFIISTSTEDAMQKASSKDYKVIISDHFRKSDQHADDTLREKLQEKQINTPVISYASEGRFQDLTSAQELFERIVNDIKSE